MADSLVDQIKTANEGIKSAAEATGTDLNNAFIALSAGNLSDGLAAVNQAITDIAPILSQSAQLPVKK